MLSGTSTEPLAHAQRHHYTKNTRKEDRFHVNLHDIDENAIPNPAPWLFDLYMLHRCASVLYLGYRYHFTEDEFNVARFTVRRNIDHLMSKAKSIMITKANGSKKPVSRVAPSMQIQRRGLPPVPVHMYLA